MNPRLENQMAIAARDWNIDKHDKSFAGLVPHGMY